MKREFSKRQRDAGYALLMVIFLVASLLLFAVMATPSVLMQGRRERDQEDIWRGKQYMRAIRLYYQKNGKYPQTMEDLTKADVSGAHYLRKVYKDLNNSEDGSWRMIYVSPTGQLIGSVRYHSLQEMAAAQALGIPAPGAAPAGATPQQGTASTAAPGQATQSPSGFSSFGSAQPASLAPLEPVSGPVLGGFLIGVGGKMKRPAVVVYQGGKRYYDWEFIWNPLTSTLGGGAQATPMGAQPAAGGTANTSPFSFSGVTATPPASPASPNGAAPPTGPPSPTPPTIPGLPPGALPPQ